MIVRTADAEEDADRFPDLGFERLILSKRQRGAVEYEILRPLCHQLVVAFGELAFAAKFLVGVDLALHHVKFTIDLGQAAFRLDQDHAVHAIGNMLRSHRHGAVIDKQAGINRREFETTRLAGPASVALAPPPGPVTAWKSTLCIMTLSS